MTLSLRKLIVLGIVACVFMLANAYIIVNWLAENGLIDYAVDIRREYITGTTITIIIVLMILFIDPQRTAGNWLSNSRRCPVCDESLTCHGRYCPECGSRV